MDKTQTLLLAAHGSKNPRANQEVLVLAQALSQDLALTVQGVFLELASPSIEEGIQEACQRGFQEVLILPYFLTQGRHTSQDIPKIVEAKQKQFPQQKIKLLDYLGKFSALRDILRQRAQAALNT